MNTSTLRILLFVLAGLSAGCHAKSARTAAAAPEGAKAAPMIYEFNVANPAYRERLVLGFYDGTPAWKWTARQFAVSIDPEPPRDKAPALTIDFSAPSEL